MPKALITAGNIFTATFENVCHATNLTFGSVNVVHIFDTIQSEEKALETGRSKIIREIFGDDTDIRTSLVEENNLQSIIPTRVSGLIDEFGTDSLIVDLSNGQKVTASVLYAVATISRIQYICALEMKVNLRSLPAETRLPDLEQGRDWEYTRIEPLKEVRYIARSSQLELVYYRDRIARACRIIQPKAEYYARDLQISLENSLLDYFTAAAIENIPDSERLERCIGGLGKICEDISILIYARCLQENSSKFKEQDKFQGRVHALRNEWQRVRKSLATKKQDLEEPFFKDVIQPTLTSDALLQSIVVYRNLVMHPGSQYNMMPDDARLVLDTTLLLIEQIGKSSLLDGAAL